MFVRFMHGTFESKSEIFKLKLLDIPEEIFKSQESRLEIGFIFCLVLFTICIMLWILIKRRKHYNKVAPMVQIPSQPPVLVRR